MNALLVTDRTKLLTTFKTVLTNGHISEFSVYKDTSIKQAFNVDAENSPDIVIVDLQSTDSIVQEATNELASTTCEIPIVAIASIENISIAMKLLNNGIQDYLIEGELTDSLIYKTILYALERKYRQRENIQHNRSIRGLLSKLSHDFDGHIRLLGTGISILREDINTRHPLLPDELEWFDLMTQRVRLMENQVSDLVVLLRAIHREHHYETVDLNQIMAEIDSDISTQTNLKYQLHADRLPALFADKEMLTTLFHAIIKNGIVYNDKDPVVTITSSCQASQDEIEITIKDNGVGIEDFYIDRIFEPFIRLHRNSEFTGTGLGLSIAKNIVSQYHGRIKVLSKINVGSQFTITLPRQCVKPQAFSLLHS